MKKLLLLIIQRYRWHIAIILGLLIFVIITMLLLTGSTVEDGTVILGFYIIFIVMLCNVSFPGMPSIGENSNNGEVFSRWCLVIITLFALLWVIYEIYLKL